MSLSDLLELRLDLPDCLVFELLDLLKRAADHAESLWVDTSRCKDLVSLSVLRLKTLLNRLELLLEDQVAQASLTVHIVDDIVELFEKLLLLLLNVLVLLQTDLILPLKTLMLLLSFDNLLLLLSKLLPHLHIPILELRESRDLFLDVLHRLNDHVIVRVPNHLLTISCGLSLLLRFEIGTQRANHVHV